MKIKIQKLVLDNFKKFDHIELALDGDSVHIYGRNAVGKTTLADAFFWCLFNKNLAGDTKFSVKPIIDGEEKHNVTTRVEVELQIIWENGSNKVETRRFTKELVEVWTKKRGSVEQVFTGHTCNYYINDVAKTEKDYKQEIEDLVPEKDFRLVTNVHAFASLKWEEQRKLLFEMLNANISDLDIIDKVPELSDLKAELEKGGRLEEIVATAKKKKKTANDALERLPIEIGVLRNRQFDAIPKGFERADVESAISEYKEELEKLKFVPVVDTRLEELGRKRNSLALDLVEASKNANRASTNAYLDHQEKREEMEKEIEDLQETLKGDEKLIEINEVEIKHLYEEYDKAEALEFDETSTVCKLCGQKLPDAKIDELKANFNNYKAEEKARIIEKGKTLRSEIDQAKVNAEKLKEKIDAKTEEVAHHCNAEIVIDPKYDLELERIRTELAEVDKQLKEASDAPKQVDPNEKAREELQEKIFKCQKILTQMDLKAQDEKDIEEKEKAIEENTKTYSEAFKIETQAEKFEKIKASMVEDKINNAFEYVGFKLFEEQINGGIKPTCVITVDGIPYNDVNSAGKIHAGLDIIKKLQSKLHIQAPIFMDNAECLSSWEIDMNGTQMIRFFVAKNEGIEIERVVE